jgi:phage pi2 protein 07
MFINLWVFIRLMRIIGTAKVTKGKKIALISDISKKLEADEGDIIVFYEADNGDILIKKG